MHTYRDRRLAELLLDRNYTEVVVCLDSKKEMLYNQQLEWCMEHCRLKFRELLVESSIVGNPIMIGWFFESSEDAFHFSLKWSGV